MEKSHVMAVTIKYESSSSSHIRVLHLHDSVHYVATFDCVSVNPDIL